MASDYIYRVTVRSTGSVQPGGGGATHWEQEVIYCGPSLRDARIAYLRSEPQDWHRGYGNSARETLIERFDAEADEIDECDGELIRDTYTEAD